MHVVAGGALAPLRPVESLAGARQLAATRQCVRNVWLCSADDELAPAKAVRVLALAPVQSADIMQSLQQAWEARAGTAAAGGKAAPNTGRTYGSYLRSDAQKVLKGMLLWSIALAAHGAHSAELTALADTARAMALQVCAQTTVVCMCH